jgi:hypothetical protein
LFSELCGLIHLSLEETDIAEVQQGESLIAPLAELSVDGQGLFEELPPLFQSSLLGTQNAQIEQCPRLA